MEAVSNNPSSDTCNKRGQDVIDQVANPVLEDLCSTCRDQLHNNRCSNEQLATEIRINVMFKFYATLKQRETHSQIENNSDTKISHTYTRELTVSPIDFVKMAKGLRLYPNLCDLQLIKKVVMKQNIEMQKQSLRSVCGSAEDSGYIEQLKKELNWTEQEQKHNDFSHREFSKAIRIIASQLTIKQGVNYAFGKNFPNLVNQLWRHFERMKGVQDRGLLPDVSVSELPTPRNDQSVDKQEEVETRATPIDDAYLEKPKVNKKRARTNRQKLKYMNNPVGIYHIYVTLNNQQRNLQLEEKLKPFEKDFIHEIKRCTGRDISAQWAACRNTQETISPKQTILSYEGARATQISQSVNQHPLHNRNVRVNNLFGQVNKHRQKSNEETEKSSSVDDHTLFSAENIDVSKSVNIRSNVVRSSYQPNRHQIKQEFRVTKSQKGSRPRPTQNPLHGNVFEKQVLKPVSRYSATSSSMKRLQSSHNRVNNQVDKNLPPLKQRYHTIEQDASLDQFVPVNKQQKFDEKDQRIEQLEKQNAQLMQKLAQIKFVFNNFKSKQIGSQSQIESKQINVTQNDLNIVKAERVIEEDCIVKPSHAKKQDNNSEFESSHQPEGFNKIHSERANNGLNDQEKNDDLRSVIIKLQSELLNKERVIQQLTASLKQNQ